MRISLIVGARPNFVKAASLVPAIRAAGHALQFIHTGQHYDHALSDSFFYDLELPAPDVHLNVGGAPPCEQTGRMIAALDPPLRAFSPDWVLVVGDTNSTLAGAVAAKKCGFKLAHVEAGLRCGDIAMQEEINRILVDRASDLLFTSEPLARCNLAAEGITRGVHFVGNVMVDTLLRFRSKELSGFRTIHPPGRYAVLTLHRAENVDDPARLRALLDAIWPVAEAMPVIFPAHPRTVGRLRALADREQNREWWEGFAAKMNAHIVLRQPCGYREFIALLEGATLALTDSGGIQEETTALNVPCLTLRESTERPVTCQLGTNQLVGADPDAVRSALDFILAGEWLPAKAVPLWDGRAAERAIALLQ